MPPMSEEERNEDSAPGAYRDPETDGDPDADGDIDWENRTLCSDESCIGVIGSDGRCKECGLPYENN